jgi:hypothetical protein
MLTTVPRVCSGHTAARRRFRKYRRIDRLPIHQFRHALVAVQRRPRPIRQWTCPGNVGPSRDALRPQGAGHVLHRPPGHLCRAEYECRLGKRGQVSPDLCFVSTNHEDGSRSGTIKSTTVPAIRNKSHGKHSFRTRTAGIPCKILSRSRNRFLQWMGFLSRLDTLQGGRDISFPLERVCWCILELVCSVLSELHHEENIMMLMSM